MLYSVYFIALRSGFLGQISILTDVSRSHVVITGFVAVVLTAIPQ